MWNCSSYRTPKQQLLQTFAPDQPLQGYWVANGIVRTACSPGIGERFSSRLSHTDSLPSCQWLTSHLVAKQDTGISHSVGQHGMQWINASSETVNLNKSRKRKHLSARNLSRNPYSSGQFQRQKSSKKHEQNSLLCKAVPSVYLGNSRGCQMCSTHHRSGRNDCAGSSVVCLLLLPQGPGSPPDFPFGDPPSRDGCQWY